MTMPVQLKSHLEQMHVSYFPALHAPARSAQYAASLLHITGKQIAKTVVVHTGKHVLLAVLPVSYHVNLKKLSDFIGAPVELLQEQECRTLFPNCQPGTVPPFGELYGLPVYLDAALADDPEIVFSAGTLSNSISVGNADFVRLAKPRVCSFADKGEPVTKQTAARDDFFEFGGGK
jgi:Ala-tRNA(Pro) deacylase